MFSSKAASIPESKSSSTSIKNTLDKIAGILIDKLHQEKGTPFQSPQLSFAVQQSVEHITNTAIDFIMILLNSNKSLTDVFYHYFGMHSEPGGLSATVYSVFEELEKDKQMDLKRFSHINKEAYHTLITLTNAKIGLKKYSDIGGQLFSKFDGNKLKIYIPICIGYKNITGIALQDVIKFYQQKMRCPDITIYLAKYNPINLNPEHLETEENKAIEFWTKENGRVVKESGVHFFTYPDWALQAEYFEAQAYFAELVSKPIVTEAIISDAFKYIKYNLKSLKTEDELKESPAMMKNT